MSTQIQKLRPGTPNPMRYQGGLRHYHVAPLPPKLTREQWVGSSFARKRMRAWLAALAVTVALLLLAGIVSGLAIELSL